MYSYRHSRSHSSEGSPTPRANIRSTTIPHAQFDPFSFDTFITFPIKRSSSRSPESKKDFVEIDSASSDDEDVEDEVYDEEDHRRLLFGLTRGGMTPQVELALRLIDEANGTISSGEGSEDDDGDDEDEEQEEEEEEEDLDSVDEEEEEGFERGYGGFPVTSRTSEEERFAVVSPPTSPTNPYAAYQPEPGSGRVRRWLNGLHLSEMVA